MMSHPMDRSPRVVQAHQWQPLGGRHMLCGVCLLAVPQDAADKHLPRCRPNGMNEDYCTTSSWLVGEREHSAGYYYFGGECAWCGAPGLAEEDCEHSYINVENRTATCQSCGKTMHGW